MTPPARADDWALFLRRVTSPFIVARRITGPPPLRVPGLAGSKNVMGLIGAAARATPRKISARLTAITKAGKRRVFLA